MMKLLKVLGYLILVVIVLAIVLPLALMIFVNPNQFKSQIESEASLALHRPIQLQGNLHWALYPVAGIKAEDVSVGNPAGFPQRDFISAKMIEFSVDLKPLLHKEVRIGKIIVDGMNLQLLKDPKGKTNWQMNIGADSNHSASTGNTKSSDNMKMAAFSISQIIIKNSQITFDDATTHKHMAITDFNFNSSHVNINQAFPITLSMKYMSDMLDTPVKIRWQSNIKYSPNQSKITFSGIHARLNDDLVLTGDESIVMGNTIQWRANLDCNNMNVENLLKLFKKKNLTISGTGTLSANLTGSGTTNSLNGDLKFSIQNGIFYGIDLYYYADMADALTNKKSPSLQNSKQTPFGSLTGTAKIQSGVVSNNDLLIHAAKVDATGSGTANLNTEQLDYRLSLQRMTSGAQAKPRGPAIPITITGNFGDPSIRLDLSALAVSEVKSHLADKVQEYAPHINQKIVEGLQSLLGK